MKIQLHSGLPMERRFLLGLSLAQLISWGSTFYLFGLLVQPIEAALQISRAQSALGFSLMLLAEGTLALPVGRLIDQGYARLVMCAGSVAVALCLFALSFVSSLAGFYALWFCLGAALSCVLYNTIFAVVTRRFPRNFRRAIITITFLGGLASTVFIPLIQYLIKTMGWREMLPVLAGLHILICLPLHWHFLRAEPRPVKLAASDLPASPIALNLRAVLRNRVFWLIGVFSSLAMAVTAAVPAHLVPLLQEIHLPDAWVVWIPACIGLVQVLGRLLLYTLEERFDLHRVNLLIALLMPLALCILAMLMWAASINPKAGLLTLCLALCFTAVFGLANGMITIVKGTAIAQYVNRQHVAALNGALGLPQAICRAISPALVGALWGVSHHYGWGIAALLLTSLTSCAAFALAQHWARQGNPPR